MINTLRQHFYINTSFKIHNFLYIFSTIVLSVTSLGLMYKDLYLILLSCLLIFILLFCLHRFKIFPLRKTLLITFSIFSFLIIRIGIFIYRNTINTTLIEGEFQINSMNKHKKQANITFKKNWKTINVNIVLTEKTLNIFNNHSSFNGQVKILNSSKSGFLTRYYGVPMKISSFQNLTTLSKMRKNMKKSIKIKFPQNYGLITGLLFGDKAYKEDYEYLHNMGLQHLTAVSGLHMTAVYSSVFWFFKVSLIRWPYLAYCCASFFSLVAILFLLFLADFSPSALRSFLMHLIRTLLIIFNLHYNKFFIWALVYCLMVVYDPCYLQNPSFLLSFYAVLGIYFSLIGSTTIFTKQMIITLFIFPFTLSFFSSFNILSLLWNSVFIEVFSKIIVVSALSCFVPLLSDILDLLLNVFLFPVKKISVYSFYLKLKFTQLIKPLISKIILWSTLTSIVSIFYFSPLPWFFVLLIFLLVFLLFTIFAKESNIEINLHRNFHMKLK